MVRTQVSNFCMTTAIGTSLGVMSNMCVKEK